MKIEITEEMRAELRIIDDMRQRLPKMRALGMAEPSRKTMGVHGVNLAILVAEAIESAKEAAAPMLPPWPGDKDLREILGRPNFACGQLAAVLRGSGMDISCKAEEEQAAVIHWLLSMYLEHGGDWRAKAEAALDAIQQAQREEPKP